MTSCKDCMHDKVCSEYFHAFWGHTANKHSDLINAEPKDCPYFKDRSRFVELPCKVGDTIYVVEKGKIIEDSVVTLYVAYFGGDEETFQFDGIKIDGYFEDFGKTVFLTREEAEKALKERES